jgi:hypothetical protein
MPAALPRSLPDLHRQFLDSLLIALQRDERIVGIAAGGSFLTDAMDEFSDLDLIIAVEPEACDDLMPDRQRIAASLGPLAVAFTGEHIGEPRLLICLYDTVPSLHVDLKFVAVPDLARRVEDPAVLWERDGRLTRALQGGRAVFPMSECQWLEDRFWVWVHYTTGKIGRGELFEAIECLSFFRVNVLGPLSLHSSGARPSGVRRFEQLAPQFVEAMQRTIAGYDAGECLHALRACIQLYRTLRSHSPAVEHREKAESVAMSYLTDIERRIAGSARSTGQQ